MTSDKEAIMTAPAVRTSTNPFTSRLPSHPIRSPSLACFSSQPDRPMSLVCVWFRTPRAHTYLPNPLKPTPSPKSSTPLHPNPNSSARRLCPWFRFAYRPLCLSYQHARSLLPCLSSPLLRSRPIVSPQRREQPHFRLRCHQLWQIVHHPRRTSSRRRSFDWRGERCDPENDRCGV
jgi:hypothetical protein